MDDDMVHMLVAVAMCLHCRPRGVFMHMLHTAQDTNAGQTIQCSRDSGVWGSRYPRQQMVISRDAALRYRSLHADGSHAPRDATRATPKLDWTAHEHAGICMQGMICCFIAAHLVWR